MSYIKSITFVLENCEQIKVEYPDVFFFTVAGIKTKFSTFSNCISKGQRVKSFQFAVRKDAKLVAGLSEKITGEKSLERLKAGDITQISIKYVDKTRDHFNVHWHDGDEMYSRLQKSEENDDFIYITSNVKEKDYVSIEELQASFDMTGALKK